MTELQDVSRPYDVVILGAGTAGLSAFRDVRKRTGNVLLVNAGPWGTTCARVGCMPSKALIAAADAYHARTRLETFGIRGAEALSVDLPAVLARVRALRDDFVAGALRATEGLEPQAVSGRGRLLAPDRVEIDGQVVAARSVILATGSRPVVPAAWRALGDRVLTSDALFEQPDLPPRVAVVGLGAIGIEIAQALARLGIEVTGVDARPRVAGLSDPAVSDALVAALGDEFDLRLGTEVELAAAGSGVELRFGDARRVVDRVIAAVGRRPNLEGLGLETLGVRLDARGLPPFDPATMRVADLPVFVAGDLAGRSGLLHEAADDGHVAALNVLAETPVRLDRRTPLGVVFCDPGAARVGTGFADLPEDALVGEANVARQGRARTAQKNRGLLRVYASGQGRLLGAEMAAPAAEHLAHLLALAVGRGLGVHDMLRMPFYHPTLEEGLRSALRGLARQLPPCAPSDLAACPELGVDALE